MKALCLMTAAIAASLPSVCLADVSCAPKDNSARILASPSPNDLHPDWTGENYVGLSWTFIPDSDDTGQQYLHGDLYSPKGAVVTPDVYIITKEWDCE
jgi:hypothetical protein